MRRWPFWCCQCLVFIDSALPLLPPHWLRALDFLSRPPKVLERRFRGGAMAQGPLGTPDFRCRSLAMIKEEALAAKHLVSSAPSRGSWHSGPEIRLPAKLVSMDGCVYFATFLQPHLQGAQRAHACFLWPTTTPSPPAGPGRARTSGGTLLFSCPSPSTREHAQIGDV